MDRPVKGSSASAHLDMLRGSAALLVAFQHVRLMLIMNTDEVHGMKSWAKAFYFLTSLGPSAVMAFFVLSGFLIGSSVIQNVRNSAWSWGNYAAARLSRIWVVLIPALVAGAVLDWAGTHFVGSSIVYSTPHYGVMLPESVIANLSPKIALGNMLCLQEIFVPTFGSNHPLWSLANEVWYYAIFPLLILSLVKKASRLKRFVYLVGAGTIFLMLTPKIRWYFLVWLMGAAIALAPRIGIRLWHTRIVSVSLVGWLALQSMKLVVVNGYISGALVALLVYCLIAQPEGAVSAFYVGLARRMSDLSYTLYLTHIPFVVLVAALIVRRGPKFHPDIEGILASVALLAAAMIYAWMMWLGFERHTVQVKRWLRNQFRYANLPEVAVGSH